MRRRRGLAFSPTCSAFPFSTAFRGPYRRPHAGGQWRCGGGPARNAVLNALRDSAFDTHGNLILPDWQGNRVRKATPGADGIFNGAADEIITTIAGNGSSGQTGHGAAAIAASVEAPTRVVVDAANNIYIHVGNNTPATAIRRIDGTTGVITTVATSVPLAYQPPSMTSEWQWVGIRRRLTALPSC